MSVEYKQVEQCHVDELAVAIRKADLEEVAAMTRDDIHKVITQSVTHSSLSASVFVNGKLAAILGVVPASTAVINTVGIPWMLGTDEIQKNGKALLKTCLPVVRQMTASFQLLENNVHAKNKVAIRFLRRIGFKIEEAEPIGIDGALFHRFTMRA